MTPSDLDRAQTRAAEAKERLADTVETLQSRLAPRTLARTAADSIADGSSKALSGSVEAVRRHPGKLAGAAAFILALLGRRQINGLIGRLKAKRAATAKPTPRRRVRPTRTQQRVAKRKPK